MARSTHAADPRDHDEHIGIARSLLEAGRVAGARRLIQIGSSTEFGCTESPADDDAPLNPTTSYGRAKAEVSSLVLEADDDVLRTAVLRPFSVYGPGDLARHLIPTAIRAALSGCPLRLASGVERDWVFVDDVARGCALTLDGRADGLSVNLASGRLIPNEQVIELVEQASGRQIEIDPTSLPPRPWTSDWPDRRRALAMCWAGRRGPRFPRGSARPLRRLDRAARTR